MSVVRKISMVFVAVLALLTLQTGAFAQLQCLFVSEGADPDTRDVILVDWLEQTYGATVDIATGDEINTGFYFTDDFLNYDFIFVSESVSSSDTDSLKGAPVPTFYTELWASKWDITGWVPDNLSPDYYGNTTSTETAVKIMNGDHPLAAGYATDTELTLVTGSDNDTDYLTYSRPQVDHITIAVLVADETREVVFGVEAGTALYNAQNTIDGSLVSTSRAAGVGVNAFSNNHLTDDAFNLIKAGLDWILADPTSVEKLDPTVPESYGLAQNFPNPFNPTTQITFEIAKPGYTTLKVYNNLGQEVTTLLQGQYRAGTYSVTFDASRLTSGVYFYQIRSGEFTEVKKMMLMK